MLRTGLVPLAIQHHPRNDRGSSLQNRSAFRTLSEIFGGRECFLSFSVIKFESAAATSILIRIATVGTSIALTSKEHSLTSQGRILKCLHKGGVSRLERQLLDILDGNPLARNVELEQSAK